MDDGGIVTLETERLLLRAFRDGDLDAYAAMCADPEVMRYIGARSVLSRDDAWRQMAMFAGHWQLRGFGLWAVEERATGAFVGRVGLYCPEGWPDRELAWTLARPHWGKGYALEAARAALAYAFETLGWPRVISLVDPDNKRSIRLAERLGERSAGDATVHGARVLVYTIDRATWQEAQAGS